MSQAVVAQVHSLLPGATVSRLAGRDRYETSSVVASNTWSGGAKIVFMAAGTVFADALSGVPAAGSVGAPVLLTPPACITTTVSAALNALAPGATIVLGGPGTVQAAASSRRC